MPTDISPGASGTTSVRVRPEHCTTLGAHTILSTPTLVMFCEDAAIEVLHPHIGDHQGSVGSTVDITHTAPTLRGQTVAVTATVAEVDRRRVAFEVSAHDGTDPIATCRHERFVVDLDKFEARLHAKRESLS